MRHLLLLSVFTFMVMVSFSQNSKISIIPEPVSIFEKQGSFNLTKSMVIKVPANTDLGITLNELTKRITVPTGFRARIVTDNVDRADITLNLNNTRNEKLGDEGYELSVAQNGVVIKANKPAGLFYGVQTFLQLLPPQIESKTLVKDVKWEAPAVEITDYPRVGWRGLMLDASRHFFTVDEVKSYIDKMVKYKYNIFHWGLTNDEGWRIEIKSLPKLTSVGAWRVEKQGNFGTFSNPLPDEPKNYGGFYTQEQVKDIVKYAKERFVDIIPEINTPGHSLAIIASYPELSCTQGAEKYNVRAGEPIMDWSRGAPPIAMIDNTLCPANEKVYPFMEKVVAEVAQLFPFEYLHMGGDEAPHNFWAKSPQVQALMKREGLKTIPQVQAYFEKRLEKIVNAHGKKMMGWDELLEGGVNKTTAIMSWRGTKDGIKASKEGHKVVMSPNQYTYIDLMQSDESIDPKVYQNLRLNQSYKFDPIPEGADAKNILGGQANLWTEQVYNIRQAEYMTWPRGFAVAESVWSPAKNKNWNKFVSKIEDHFERLQYAQTKYSPAMYEPVLRFKNVGQGKYQVSMDKEIEDVDIYYSFDNSEPDNYYPKYTAPVNVPKDAQKLRIVTYRNGKQAGRQMIIRKDDWERRAGK